MTLTQGEVAQRERVICEAVVRDSTARTIQASTRALLDIRESHEALQADNERLTDFHSKAVAEAVILTEEKADRDEEIERLREERGTLAHEVLELVPENERLREALRENVGEAYNLITQGESPMARRQPSAQHIYDRSKEALAQTKEGGRA